MARRSALLIAALGVAALGTLLIILWVQGIDERAKEDQELVEVLVAAEQIDVGETLEDAQADGKFETRQINRIAQVDGAISSPEALQGLVAVETIYPDEQILPQKWGEPGTEAALDIPEENVAISVELADPDRVAGFVTPGSQVAVYCTALDAQAILPGGQNQELGDYTRIIVPRTTVLGIGSTTVASRTTTNDEGESTTEEIPKTVVTLSVDQNDAEKIILCRQSANPTLALLTEDSDSELEPGAFPRDLFPELFRRIL